MEGDSMILSAMAPIFWLSRLAGCFPLDSLIDLSPLWSLLPVLFAAVTLADAYFFHKAIVTVLDFTRLIYAGIPWVLAISTALLAFLSFYQRRLYRKLLDSVATLEMDLLHLGVKPKYSRKEIITDIVTRLLFLLSTMAITYKKNLMSFKMFVINAVGFYVTQLCINTVEMHIVALATYLADLFKTISSALPSWDIERHLEAATKLVETTATFHSLFSKQAFIISSTLFITSTIDLYFFMIIHSEGFLLLANNPSSLLRTATRAYELWRMVSSVHWLKEQARTLDAKLFTVALQDTSNEIAENEKLILYFSMKQTVKFSACGFFPMDFTLLHSVVTAAANYLFILLQFGNEKAYNPVTARNVSTPLFSTDF